GGQVSHASNTAGREPVKLARSSIKEATSDAPGTNARSVVGASAANAATASAGDEPHAPSIVPLFPESSAARSAATPSAACTSPARAASDLAGSAIRSGIVQDPTSGWITGILPLIYLTKFPPSDELFAWNSPISRGPPWPRCLAPHQSCF